MPINTMYVCHLSEAEVNSGLQVLPTEPPILLLLLFLPSTFTWTWEYIMSEQGSETCTYNKTSWKLSDTVFSLAWLALTRLPNWLGMGTTSTNKMTDLGLHVRSFMARIQGKISMVPADDCCKTPQFNKVWKHGRLRCKLGSEAHYYNVLNFMYINLR